MTLLYFIPYSSTSWHSKYMATHPSNNAFLPYNCTPLQEFELRPVAISHIKSDVDLKTKTVNAWIDTKPWINETEREEVLVALEGLLKFVADKEAEQAKKLDHETPAFLVNDLGVQTDKVDWSPDRKGRLYLYFQACLDIESVSFVYLYLDPELKMCNFQIGQDLVQIRLLIY